MMTAAGCSRSPGEAQPNIVLIVSDDAGYADFGAYGGQQIPTPNIDSIARDGVRFSQGYVTASVCAPSRAGLLTGRYQQRFGNECNNPGASGNGMPPEETTIAEALRALGYRTMIVGKWHQGWKKQFNPLNHGFDSFFGFRGGGRGYFPEKPTAPKEHNLYRDFAVQPESSVTYTTEMFTDAAVDFIGQSSGEPFFLYLAYNAVHVPMQALRTDFDRFAAITDEKRRTYAGMTAALDRGVGRVLGALRERGWEQNTLIFFINDNGGATNNASDNGALRGWKGSLWEGGIRVAFMVKWPRRLAGGIEFTEPVTSLDIMPTAIAAAGGDLRDYPDLDGVDLLPHLLGQKKEPPHQYLFWRYGPVAAVRHGPWKLIRCEQNPTLLLNLEENPGESRNYARQYPQIASNLLDTVAEWEKGLAAPKWRERERGRRIRIRRHRIEAVPKQDWFAQ